MAKCKTCPHKKICRNECYGENPCNFALAFDRLARKIADRDELIAEQKATIRDTSKGPAALDSRIFGDYLLIPVLDPSTGKVSWWISKKGFAAARYCFTASDGKEVSYQIKNGLNGYMALLDDTLQGIDTKSRIDRFISELLWILPKEPGSDHAGGDMCFWTDGSEILCQSKAACENLATFLDKLLCRLSSIAIHTGYYDPEEDVRNDEVDKRTGFYYIEFE